MGELYKSLLEKKTKTYALQDICLTFTKTQAPGAYGSQAICLTLFTQVVIFTSAKKINMYKQKISSPSHFKGLWSEQLEIALNSHLNRSK